MENKTSGILLRILNLIAISDGSVSAEEEDLLEKLLERYRLHNKLSSWEADFENSNDIKALAAAIGNKEDRCLAAKLTYMVAAISRNSEDDTAINPAERKVYRELTEALGLTSEELNIIEKEGDGELTKQPNLMQILYGAMGNLNYWPEPGFMGTGSWSHF